MPDRAFHIGDLLSVSTGLLVSPEHIGGVYKILNHMTGDSLFTHQLPLACPAVLPDLLQQHPWLRDIEPPAKFDSEEHIKQWVDEMGRQYGYLHPVTPAPLSWGKHNPISDFTNQYPDKPVIGVVLPEGDHHA